MCNTGLGTIRVEGLLMLLCAVGSLPPAARVEAGDATQWRGGPARTGDFSGGPKLVETWPAAGPKLLWKTSVPMHRGYGSISVDGGRAYFAIVYKGAPEGAKHEKKVPLNAVFCLDAETGAVLWKREFPCTEMASWAGAGGTPAVAEGRVYVTLAATTEKAGSTERRQVFNGTIYCLEAKTGKPLWQAEQEASGTGFRQFGGLHSSPLVADGVCVVQGTATIAYEAATGKPLWERKAVGEAYASPTLWRSGSRALLLCNSKYPLADADKKLPGMPFVEAKSAEGHLLGKGRAVFCLDLQTGEPKWAVAMGYDLWVCGTPAVAGDILLDQDDRGLTALRLSAEKPLVLWHSPLPCGGYFGPSPSVAGEYVYATGRTELVCIKLATGQTTAKLPFGVERQAPGTYMSPAAADGRAVYTVVPIDHPQPGTLVLARGGPDMRELARFSLPGLLEYCSPTLANGKLFLRLRDAVTCYDLRAAPYGEEKHP